MATESDSFSEKDPKRTRKNGDRSVIATDHGGSAAALPDLPYEIVVEILSRLPVKSLLRFRCVRKSWLSLISDPKFVRMHLHMSTVNDNNSHHRLIVLGRHRKLTSCKSWTLNSIYSDQCDDPTDLDFLMEESFWHCHLFGYCDGLICMRFDEGDFFVWNPHLKESRRLPSFEVEADLGLPVNWEYYFAYGFGYDCSVDDYKVVAMLCLPRNNDRADTEVRVGTLRANSWRRIQEFPNGCRPCENCDQPAGIFVGGSLHWLSIDRSVGLVSDGNDSRDSKKIIALDLATEIFHEVALPTYGFTDELVLGVIRGCLCVAIVYTDTRLTDLWMLKEYGVRESWTRLASFPYFSNSPGPGFRAYHTPLFVSRTNVLLWKFSLGIILYNLKDDTFRSSVAENFFSYIHNSAIYIESLVSPNAER